MGKRANSGKFIISSSQEERDTDKRDPGINRYKGINKDPARYKYRRYQVERGNRRALIERRSAIEIRTVSKIEDIRPVRSVSFSSHCEPDRE